MRKKCKACGNIFSDGSEYPSECTNCGCGNTMAYDDDMTWYNRYASENIMTQEEAREFFETDRY